MFISGFFSQQEEVLGKDALLLVTVHLRIPLTPTTVDTMSIFKASRAAPKLEWVENLKLEWKLKFESRMDRIKVVRETEATNGFFITAGNQTRVVQIRWSEKGRVAYTESVNPWMVATTPTKKVPELVAVAIYEQPTNSRLSWGMHIQQSSRLTAWLTTPQYRGWLTQSSLSKLAFKILVHELQWSWKM